MRRFLFPISLGNNVFSTENVMAGLRAIRNPYEEASFIIADQIQLYNRALTVRDGSSLDDTIRRFYSGRTLFEQRRIWLDRVKREFSGSGNFPQWTIYGLDDIADQMFTRIYRNVIIMFHTIVQFQIDVENEARDHLSKRSGASNNAVDNISLSVSYILEEIAASIRLHVCEDITDEYYLGKHLDCVLKLYSLSYGINVFSIAGVEPKPLQWRFFEFSSDSEGHRWVERGM